jgi:hypothetical protein
MEAGQPDSKIDTQQDIDLWRHASHWPPFLGIVSFRPPSIYAVLVPLHAGEPLGVASHSWRCLGTMAFEIMQPDPGVLQPFLLGRTLRVQSWPEGERGEDMDDPSVRERSNIIKPCPGTNKVPSAEVSPNHPNVGFMPVHGPRPYHGYGPALNLVCRTQSPVAAGSGWPQPPRLTLGPDDALS